MTPELAATLTVFLGVLTAHIRQGIKDRRRRARRDRRLEVRTAKILSDAKTRASEALTGASASSQA